MAPAILAKRPKILFLDAYDSFSNNIVAQVEECIDAEITQIYIDDPLFIDRKHHESATGGVDGPPFAKYVQNFDAVIAGPGPGWADDDVGLIQELWGLQDSHLLPVLGICLGFQSMTLAFGAKIERLNEPRHGLVSEILHKGRSLFSGVDQLLTTQYHSLQVNIGHAIQTKRTVSYPAELWRSTNQCPDLEPLAWDFDNRYNGAVLMAAKHVQKPFWGVQFHPESICTNSEGGRIVQNWWVSAQAWNCQYRLSQNRISLGLRESSGREPWQDTEDITQEPKRRKTSTKSGHYCRTKTAAEEQDLTSNNIEHIARLIAHGNGRSLPDLPPDIVHCTTTGSGRLKVADVCETFDIPRNEAIVLESGLQSDLRPMRVGTGRYSIIGLIISGETPRIHYSVATQVMQLRNGNNEVVYEAVVDEPWAHVKAVMQHLKPKQTPSGPNSAPFWGGLMGYASYEAGLEITNVPASGKTPYPDICFAYITRSIVFDHQVKKIYIQSIRGHDDQSWIDDTHEKICHAAHLKSLESTPNPTPLPKPDPFDTDAALNMYLSSCEHSVAKRTEYCQTVSICQDYIKNGHSYELCLTSANKIRARRLTICRRSPADNNELSWKLYKRLAKRNPAPFSAYLRLHNVHVLSSSPERYISWDRNQSAQCRPIKGTVQKRAGVTAADAHHLLSSPKERAENLMIVDLTRHQLHGVYGAGNVHVTQLMQVEEYETVYQLVSVIDAVPPPVKKRQIAEGEWEDPVDYTVPQADFDQEGEGEGGMLGFDAFVKSLPPGSMTGAPKKRSCEILQAVEKGKAERRGIYAGVLGYFDVGGGGDFSVVIRTAVKTDPSPSSSSSPFNPLSADEKEDVWTIGAGGAITSLSDPEAEYEEMRGKFTSTASAFRVGKEGVGGSGDGAERKEACPSVFARLEEVLLEGQRRGLNMRMTGAGAGAAVE